MKGKLQEWMYRKLRNNMVLRMRRNGMNFRQVNTVLKNLRQKQITKMTKVGAIEVYTFEWVKPEKKMEYNKQGKFLGMKEKTIAETEIVQNEL